MTTAPAKAAGPVTLTKPGTTLKFGQTANVQAGDGKDKWIATLKVTALEKAPTSDYQDLGFRGNVGSVYYLRYEVTYVGGTPTKPPSSSDIIVSQSAFRLALANRRGRSGFPPVVPRLGPSWGPNRPTIPLHVNPRSLPKSSPMESSPSPSFKNCLQVGWDNGQVPWKSWRGSFTRTLDELAVGETRTNLCLPFAVDKGTVTQVHATTLDDGSDYGVTWK